MERRPGSCAHRRQPVRRRAALDRRRREFQVRNAEGRIATAINVSMPYHPDAEREAMRDILPHLKLTAAAIEGCAPSHRLRAVCA